jgi:hypothetical protein
MKHARIVVTGIGLTAPNGNSLAEFRQNLLNGVAGVERFDVRYMGNLLAGVCHYDPLKYQKKKEVRVGTRAGSISIYCAREALADSKVNFDLHRLYRARQRRDRKRDLRYLEIQLRHQVLVALPQPAHRRQQPRRRNVAEPRHHRPGLHDRCRLRRG